MGLVQEDCWLCLCAHTVVLPYIRRGKVRKRMLGWWAHAKKRGLATTLVPKLLRVQIRALLGYVRS